MMIEYSPIGVIRSPFRTIEGMPIQPAGASGVQGTIEVFPEFEQGLKDLDGFSHIILLYHFHRVEGYSLLVTPFMDTIQHGLFSTRAPKRPNPIGISVVRLVQISGLTLDIENVDILDGTPLLDIKPYVPQFDNHPADSIGWLEDTNGKAKVARADGRFR
ncbi:MAG: tRNA (N6-threonylcarbamoyladenosine(37)-N6)-methyltransferase TrmO [Desulfobacteraceae bacterium IS3]|nr:MAG: tRNA (N6-threonylcarbamoyladenosine(37)-N6)-methyltransferase TrmO [Desulfobacteraceae bacterium IS3]